MPITGLLIANHGEVAIRVARAAAYLQAEDVSLYRRLVIGAGPALPHR
jgi:pyruvate carboxylase